MKVLIIGLGELGNHILGDFLKDNSNQIEIYTRDNSKYENFKYENVSSLKSLSDAKQPDIIFIAANLYKPEDRFKYLEDNFNTDKYYNVRDDEKEKNQEMVQDVIKGIKHLKAVPVIVTANPPELLVKTIHDELGWNSVYNMQMMLDNKRISKITNLPVNNCLCIGEHGNPVPTLSHVKELNNSIYEEINLELSRVVTKIHHEYKGTPPLIDAKEALDTLVESILSGKELDCVLTTYNADTKTGFGKPFIVKGLNFEEQEIPKLSEIENLLLEGTNKRLINKWNNEVENANEIKIKMI